MSSRGDICSAINCNNKKNNPNFSFFRVPKDGIRSKRWVINSRREDLMKKDCEYLYNNIKFCSNHFENSEFMNTKKNKLVWDAIPTLFDETPTLFDVPNKPQQITLNGKLPDEPIVTQPDEPSPNKMKLYLNDKKCNYEETSNDKNIKMQLLKDTVKNLKRLCWKKNVEIARLRKKIKERKGCVCKIKTTVSRSINTSHITRKNQAKLILSKYLKKQALSFVMAQIKHPLKSKYSNRWDEEMKILSLNLLYCIPLGYTFLSKYFNLPSVRTLQKFVKDVRLQSGVSENILTQFKEEVQQVPVDE